MYKIIFGFTLTYLLSMSCFATGNGVYSVTKVGCAATNGLCWVSISPPVSTTINDCASGYEARFNLSDPAGQAALSLAMTAYTTGKKLEIYTQDGVDCIGQYPRAAFVTIVD